MFPVRKFYIEQMFVLVRMQFHNHVDQGSQPGVREPPGVHGKISRGIWMAVECSMFEINTFFISFVIPFKIVSY